MRDLRWQILIAVGGLLLVVGILLGQKPSVQSEAPEPVSGGAHVEALLGRPIRLNPVLDFNNQVDEDVDRLLYRGLARFDSRGNPVPDLADRWAVSADASLVTVTLRDDAVWHDGEPVESADIVYTFSRFKEPGYPGPEDLQAFWQEVEIVQLDDLTVQFQLPEPYAPFLDFLSVGLLPDHLLRGVSSADLPDHPFNLQPVGTGPFRFERFMTEGDRIRGVSLLAYDGFYGQQPYLDRIEFHYFESPEQAFNAYDRGEIGAIGSVDETILSEVLAAPNLNLYSARLPEVKLVYFNLSNSEKPFLQEEEVRQSLRMAVNRQAIVDKVLDGQGIVAPSPILPGTWAFAEGLQPVPFQPIQAEETLDRLEWEVPAGASQGSEEYVRAQEDRTLSFELLLLDRDRDRAIANHLQEYWSRIGVEVNLETVSEERLSEALESRSYQAALTDLTLSRWPDPDPYTLWHDSQAEAGQNYAGFNDRNTGIWLERARTTPDQTRRAELYASFQYRFQDQVPAMLLYYPIYNYAISAQMQGVNFGPVFDPSDRFAEVENWFLLARRIRPTATPAPP